VSFALNVAMVCCVGRKRTSRSVDPLRIALSTFCSPLYMIATDAFLLCREAVALRRGSLLMMVCVPLPLAAAAYRISAGATYSWFEDALLGEVWFFLAVFAVRKLCWLCMSSAFSHTPHSLPLHLSTFLTGDAALCVWCRCMEVRDRAEITRYFATTCFDFIEHAPVCEMIYSATTGYNSLVGSQMGKVAFLAAARAIPGMLPRL
jgi:hypothetical protein